MIKPNLFTNLIYLDLEYCSDIFLIILLCFLKWWMMLFMSKFLQFFVCFYRKFQIHFSYLWDVASKNRPRFKLICFAHLLMRVLWFQRNVLGACRFLNSTNSLRITLADIGWSLFMLEIFFLLWLKYLLFLASLCHAFWYK